MMNKIPILFVVLTLIFFSCYHENHPQVEVPDNLLTKKQMVEILTDIYLAEGAMAYQRLNKKLNQDISTSYYNQIFEEYHITHRILKDNLRYYNSDAEVMEDMLEDVLSNLSEMQAQISAMADPLSDTIPQNLNDTLTRHFPPSALYDESWSFASLIDSLLFIPVDTLIDRMNDQDFDE